MISTHGEWESTESVVYHFATEDPKELDVIYKYRHKLMERFVEYAYNKDIESTRIICFDTLDSENMNVDFEFTLKSGKRTITPEYLLHRSGFDRVVHRLFAAVEAEEALKVAESVAKSNTF